MKKAMAKRKWMMGALVAALGVAVYLNYYFTTEPSLTAGTDTSPSSSEDGALGDAYFVNGVVSDVPKEETPSDETASTQEEDYFDNARASRVAAREESLRLIQETLGRSDASAEEKQKAQEQATTVAQRVLQESNIENMIVAKGFSDCVVFLEGDTCSVVVAAQDLQQAESMQILDIVLHHASVSSDKVQITAKNG